MDTRIDEDICLKNSNPSKKRYEELTQQMTAPAVIADQTRYTKVAKQHRDLEPIVEKYRELEDSTAR